MIIGVSGKSGSGKSSVSKYIANELKYTLLDLDLISKNIRISYKADIVGLIDEDILEGNEIDSKKLGKILFSDSKLMNKYNEFVYAKLKEEILKYEGENVVIDSIFLPIMDVFEKIDVKILVKCDDSKRKIRVMKRDNISEEYFLLREKNALEYNDNQFDYIVDNDIDYIKQLDDILNKIKR